MNFSIIITLILCNFFNFFNFLSCQVVRKGTCPNLPILVDFKINEYMGVWYEAKRYKNYFQRGCDCAWSLYKMDNNGTVTVNTWMKQLEKTKNWGTQWKAKLRSPNIKPIPGQLNIFTSEKPYKFIYSILDTDYTNYSVVWNCYPIANYTYVEHAWVLYRKFPVDKESQIKVDEIIENYLDLKEFRDTEIAYNECWDPNVLVKFDMSDDTDDDLWEPTTVVPITEVESVASSDQQGNGNKESENQTFNPELTPDMNPFEFFNVDENSAPEATPLPNDEEINIFAVESEEIKLNVITENILTPIDDLNLDSSHEPHHKKEPEIL